MADAARIQHVENMRVAQARIHEGDTKWFVVTANGFVTRGPYAEREHAELALAWVRNQAAKEEDL